MGDTAPLSNYIRVRTGAKTGVETSSRLVQRRGRVSWPGSFVTLRSILSTPPKHPDSSSIFCDVGCVEVALGAHITT